MRIVVSELSIIGFLCLISGYHSLHTHQLQSRSLRPEATETLSIASQARDAANQGGLQHMEGLNSVPENIGTHSSSPMRHEQSLQDLSNYEHVKPVPTASEGNQQDKFVGVKSTAIGLEKPFSRVTNILGSAKSIFRILTRKPNPNNDVHIIKFEDARDSLAKFLVSPGLDLGPHKPFNLENLAKSLEKNFPILPGISEEASTRSLFADYLHDLRKYQLIVNENGGVRKTWITKIPSEEDTETETIMEEVSKFLTVHPHFVDEFQEEHEQAVGGIAPVHQWKLSEEKIRYFFQPASVKEEAQNAINMYNFVKARAVQLKKRIPPELEVLDMEHVFQHLPPDLDLKAELFRYLMIECFETLLKLIRSDVTRNLEERARSEIAHVLAQSSIAETGSESIFKIAAKEDEAWHENAFEKFYAISMSPSEVFQKLTRPPSTQEINTNVINKYMNSLGFLSDIAMNELRYSESSKSFSKRLTKAERFLQNRNAGDKTKNLKTIENIRSEASRSYSVNLPLVDKLFDKGIIDKSYREVLITKAQVSRKQFAAALGTDEDFTKRVTETFEANLVNHLQSMDQVERRRVLISAADAVARSRLKQLDQDAKATYLTTDAFEKPNSLRFNEALKAYHPEFNRFMQQPTDSKALARAYMDTTFYTSPFNPQSEKYLGFNVVKKELIFKLDRKLYEIENVFYEHMPKMGDFFEHILKNDVNSGASYLTSVNLSSKKAQVPFGKIHSWYLVSRVLTEQQSAKAAK
ncbi:hypothetical protein PGT21_015192 [Puccinia graminis f. sp. tritici]|uniref:Uncharacterized protein n=1 Tax=Puccinia graminis f. sp. tritici TaxID=56615 RepID=A0A5B0N5S5_PUCGR|nr:hypothetical protein PGTUg99_019792 [Puccinia graminis f. sp. tritici]KAA1094254.1 hypothetical protein PGT21_015192 [Puccinia graminis f. sp. tritici]